MFGFMVLNNKNMTRIYIDNFWMQVLIFIKGMICD